MFAQISKSFKFLKELQLLHSLISLNWGIIFLAHQYFLKSCHDNFKNVLLYLLPHSGIYAVNVCKIKRTENYISKMTLSDSWFMLFFSSFIFYFILVSPQELGFLLTKGCQTGRRTNCSTYSCLADSQELC